MPWDETILSRDNAEDGKFESQQPRNTGWSQCQEPGGISRGEPYQAHLL